MVISAQRMKAVCFRIVCVMCFTGVLAGGNLCLAENWTQTSAPITNWSCVTSSADGSKLFAATTGGFIYASTNSGLSWTQTLSPTNAWTSLACSADGTQVFAATPYGYEAFIYHSSNSGATWQPTGSGQGYWTSVACSADGARVAAVGFYEVYVSVNSAVTWAVLGPGTVPASLRITLVASSADGNVLAVVETDSFGPPSTINITPASTWADFQAAVFDGKVCTSVAMSADGTRIAAVADSTVQPPATNCGGILYAAWNSGTIAATNCTTVTNWTSIASSANGSRLAAVAGDGAIYTSTDAGTNWQPASVTNANWSGLASSADGGKLVAVANGGGIYTWQATPAPALNVTASRNALLISWVIPSKPFVLQQNSGLDSTNWMDLAAPPVLNLTNLQNQVTMPFPTAPMFYRLKSLAR